MGTPKYFSMADFRLVAPLHALRGYFQAANFNSTINMRVGGRQESEGMAAAMLQGNKGV